MIRFKLVDDANSKQVTGLPICGMQEKYDWLQGEREHADFLSHSQHSKIRLTFFSQFDQLWRSGDIHPNRYT